jgi:hypothetical protein
MDGMILTNKNQKKIVRAILDKFSLFIRNAKKTG